MEINTKLCNNAVRKIALLITKANDLDMDISGYGMANENQYSGHVYLWLEDYPFTLFIDLGSDTVKAMWTNPEDGNEVDFELTSETTLCDLYDWVSELESESEND